jgi:hypothetical protein
MVATDALRTKLRALLDERIPAGGSDADTRFSNGEIDTLLEEAASITLAASAGWSLKASWAMSNRGGIEETAGGEERHRFVALKDYRDHCVQMAERYRKEGEAGSLLLEVDAPTFYETDG